MNWENFHSTNRLLILPSKKCRLRRLFETLKENNNFFNWLTEGKASLRLPFAFETLIEDEPIRSIHGKFESNQSTPMSINFISMFLRNKFVKY